jgi:hypothetical protein
MPFQKGQIPWNRGLTKDDPRVAKACEAAHQAAKGKPPWNKGLTKETDSRVAKMAQGLLGNQNSKGKKPWLFGLTKETDIRVARMAESLKAKGHPHTEVTKQKLSVYITEKYENDPEYRARHKKASEALRGKPLSPAHRQKVSESIKTLWEDPHYISRQVKARQKRPTEPERKIIKLIEDNELPYKYVGDGQVIIGKRCPDFINTNGKKEVIEVFGTYWHNILDMGDRIENYRQYGFNCLIIWEDELNDSKRVLAKIKKFEGSKR